MPCNAFDHRFYIFCYHFFTPTVFPQALSFQLEACMNVDEVPLKFGLVHILPL